MPRNPTEFWAFVAGATGIGVLLIARRGLKSLKLTRADMLTRATREARQCALDRAEEMAQVLIPANAPILAAIAKNTVPVFVKHVSEVQFDPDNAGDLEAASEWIAGLPEDVRLQSLRLINRLEAWAMYFTHQLAEPAVAFGPCAPVFCSMIVQNYALLLVVRSSASAGKYPNAVKLFRAWVAKLDEEQRGLLRGNLLGRLAALQAQGPAPEHLLAPLGTKLDVD